MSQRVIAFTGISGVGKTTFLSKLAELITFQHVTGGSLIAAARAIAPGSRDTMRHADLDENQRLLIQGFYRARDPDAGLIVMDGHVVVDTGEGLTKISSDVFKALDVMAMVHLEADPSRIAQNRSRDSSRSRPKSEIETLKMHQDASRRHASFIADSLKIDFLIVGQGDVSSLANRLTVGFDDAMPTKTQQI
ncbi:adenylate kinase [Celeribacter ethanolicus]|uniref:Adenylate kinase n=1 Tax=Celeribacter ethanolicus TaxID=1758178 RepID=A0A291GAQ5_9RHOB|nr:AAA family ATPase [Celeribacter ethanolicus]ATG47132.1 adenylate kinase [Celeribacter ethanolicus]